jgi:hypothetical protein
LANFKLSSDGNGGTLIIDPPVTNIVDGNGSSANARNAGFAVTAANWPNGEAASISSVTVGPVIATEKEVSIEDAGSIIPNFAVSISVTAADAHIAGSVGAAAPSLTITPEDRNSGAANRPNSITTGGVSTNNGVSPPMTMVVASSQFGRDDAATDQHQALFRAADDGRANGVAREIVSPHDVIRAIDDGEIAIKRADANTNRAGLGNRVWLFDDAEGTFVPPAPEPLTIVIDREHSKTPSTEVAESLELAATAAMVSARPIWLSAVRQFGRKAARVVSWEANE